MSKKILVLSASVGAGHLRAAQAVELAIKAAAPDALVQNLDVLEFTNAAFRRVYAHSYLDLVNRAPHVLGYFYDLLDREPSPRKKSDRLRYALEKLNLGKFLRFLREGSWDIIVNTHFLPAEMIAALRSKEEIRTPQLTVTTDFETHRLWINQPCEHYFTATEEGAVNLTHWGVPAGDVTVTGIPIHPAFSRLGRQNECRAKHGLSGERPVLLQLAGGFGVGPVEELFDAVLAVEIPLELVVVTGRNEALRQKLQQRASPARHLVQVIGFTNEMHELMTAADLVMSKPGGLTTSEALACGAALVVVNPIPGQESRNSDFLLENAAAMKINNVATLSYKLTQLLRDPERIAQLKRNARQLGRPDAAFRIARAALDWPQRPGNQDRDGTATGGRGGGETGTPLPLGSSSTKSSQLDLDRGPLTAQDYEQLARHGIPRLEADWQLQVLRSRIVLDRPCTVGDGIRQVPEEVREVLLALHDEAAKNGRWSKFVPASGAASRMFGLKNDGEVANLCQALPELAFCEDLDSCLRVSGQKLSDLLQRKDYSPIIAMLLHEPGLAYADSPKALVKFHRYAGTSRTPFEEHLRETAITLRGGDGRCRVHFTISDHHRTRFEELLAQLKPALDAELNARLEVDFSVQKPATDTLALDQDGQPLRNDDGTLVLLPGGHGALLDNVNDLQADLIFVKNIDNVGHERLRAAALLWTGLLGGYLIQLERARQRCLLALETDASPMACQQAEAFIRDSLPGLADLLGNPTDALPYPDQLRRVLHRPLRVCGVVRNEDEPGGGPFWVREPDGSRNLQIVESVEVEPQDKQQQQCLGSATHFNPVFMALAVRDHHGSPFNLHDYVDRRRVMLTRKATQGRSVRVLERPGLWNGAMAKWATVFVEVPREVFSPVKTVLDLLRSEHR